MTPEMDDEFAEPRNVESDLADITSRLGEPEATFRTNIRRVAWRFTLGVLFVVAAAGLHFVLWSGLVPWPRGAIFWKVLLIGLVISPAAGLYLIYFAVSGMKLWVLTYPTGLFVWHRGKVVAFPWDEIAAHARANSMSVISGDFDFGDLTRYAPADYNGLVVVQPPRKATRTIILKLIEQFLNTPNVLAALPGRLVIVAAGRIRVRPAI